MFTRIDFHFYCKFNSLLRELLEASIYYFKVKVAWLDCLSFYDISDP